MAIVSVRSASSSSPPSSTARTAPSCTTPTMRELLTKCTPEEMAVLCSESTIFCQPSSTYSVPRNPIFICVSAGAAAAVDA